MYPTASAPQYAFGPSLAPVPMPMMASGGLASLPAQRFQSGGGVMNQFFTEPLFGIDVPGLGKVGPTMSNVVGVFASPAASKAMGLAALANKAYQAYQTYKSLQEEQEPAPVVDAAVDAYSPPPPGIAIGAPASVSVEGISPGYTEPGRAQAVVEAMIAMQQQEQEQAQAEAQAAQTAAMAAQQAVDASMDVSSAPDGGGSNVGPGVDTSPTGAMDAGIGGIGAAMGGSDPGSGGGGGGPSDGGDGTGDGRRHGGLIQNYQYGGQVMNYAQGGLPSLANRMASKGRYGDSMLVHMSPQEVQGLQRLAMANGTSLSVNPYTGMPEAFSLKKMFKKIAKFVAPILPFIPIPGIAGLSPLITKALLSTAVGGLSGKKGFDLKRGLLSGLTTYGIGSLAQGAGAAGSVDAPKPLVSNVDPSVLEGMDASQVANAVAAPVPAGPDFTPGTMMDPISGNVLPPVEAPGRFLTEMPQGSSFTDYVKQTGENIQTAGKGLYDTVTGAPGARAAFTSGQEINPFTDKPLGVGTAAGAAFTGVAGMKTLEELEKAKAEADKILKDVAARTEEEKAYARKILADYPVQYRRITGQEVTGFGMAMGGRINSYDDEIGGDDSMMQGGIAALAKGGLPPRYLRGGGDGMSDSIRANIEGKQEARLADGEFVVPADVVSHLGNGSSNAGAKRLYSMMDRVRKSRTGKTRQAPEVNTRRLMPA